MSDIFVLAARLRDLDDEQLAKAVRDRDIRPIGIKDFFDLAEALLDRQSIQQRLTRLDRATLTVMAAIAAAPAGPTGSLLRAADVATTLSSYPDAPNAAEVENRVDTAVAGLLAFRSGEGSGAGVALYDAVAEQLRSWPAFGLPGLVDLASPMPLSAIDAPTTADTRFVDRIASERAFAATAGIAELLAELEREPARELAKGGIALPDSKRLAHAMAIDLATVPTFLSIGIDSGLVARENGAWLITDAGADWLLESSGSRWQVLATGWFERVPSDIRFLLRERSQSLWGTGLRRFVDWVYPAGGEWMDGRIAAYTVAAELLGITANHAPSSPGLVLLADGPAAARTAMAALLPREIEQVYLQHDLSIVAPGPLTPRIDVRLRSIADAEGRALASSYRVSASSLNRAMAAGETAQSVREFLGSITLTGIPQPLDYLISEAARRYGLLRAGEATAQDSDAGGGEHPGRSYVRSDDVGLLGTVLVDQNLSALGFMRVDDRRLVSRFALDQVFWSLSDARYPVAAETASGEIVGLVRRRHARPAVAGAPDLVADLVARLRLTDDAAPEEVSEAWLARQLDTAIRTKTSLTVSVTMPGGAVVDYQPEPTSVAGGRLRARDRRADVERTLPVASITRVGPPLD
ncbi:MAG: helicase-associated domain-containing protein [Burkholderiaceae bacterium]|nr:helicase-associated domain-containing protein [Microbacteriaceae bacterium]